MTEGCPIVFVIDDDPSVRRSLARLFRSAGYAVETYPSAVEFLQSESGPPRPGCIVLDIRMPELDGLDLQEELAGRDYALPIVFITGHGDIPTAVIAMKKGAVDFLSKPFDDEELLRAVQSALARESDARAAFEEEQAIRQRLQSLTPREYEVLTYLLTGMLNKQIAGALNITEKTVIVHRGRVLRKMGVASVAELVQLASTAGVRPPADRS
jgi:FixJ family two-component response regulator